MLLWVRELKKLVDPATKNEHQHEKYMNVLYILSSYKISSNFTLSIFVLTFVKYHAISYLITWIAIIFAAMQSWFWRKSKKSAFCRRLIDKFARTAESAGSLRLLVKRHVKVHFVASLQSIRNLECFIEPKSNHLSGLVISWLVWFANPIAAVKCGPCLVTE